MTQPLAVIIEDDKDLARIFSSAMEAAGFAIKVVNDGKMPWLP